MTNVIGGSNDWFFAPLASALPLIKDGKLQALSVSTKMRASTLPQVPTSIEAGLPASDYTLWVGMIVPSATPAALVKRLHEEAPKDSAKAMPQRLRTEGRVMSILQRWGLSTKSYSIK